MKSESIAALSAALAKAQAAFPPIPRTKEVLVTSDKGSYKFRYAPYEDILRAVRPALAENGLSFTQGMVGNNLETTVMHSSGEWFSSEVPVVIIKAGAQGMGSGLTYSKRYGFCGAFGIQADDDDDGNAADGNHMAEKPSITPAAILREHYDSLPQDMKDYLDGLAHDLRTMLGKDDAEGAWLHLEAQELNNENKSALWSLLDSKCRAAIKKQSQLRKE